MAKTRQGPLVSVVIPHRGDDAPLEKCIQALRSQTFSRQETEVLIVLNEEVERLLSFSLEPGEKLLWQPEFYSYAARNKGILQAKGRIIAFTDSDTVPSPTWLDEGVWAFGEGVDMVAGRIDLTFTRQPLRPAACYEKLFAFDQEKNAQLGRSATANLLVRKNVFAELGCFDSRAKSGEDFAWSHRASRAGSTLKYSPSAIVLHPARETWSELFDKASRKTDPVTRVSSLGEGMKLSFARMRAGYLSAPSQSRKGTMSLTERLFGYFVNLVLMFFISLALVPNLTKKR